MEKKDVEDLIGRDFALKKLRNTFEKMIPGAYCVHRSFGIGQLKGYDREKTRLAVDFGGSDVKLMDPVFCVKKLEILPDDDMLIRFHRNPDEIRQKTKKSSVSLLVEFLEKFPDRRASLGDIEKTFGKIVEEKNFRRWWNVTKKLIVREPRLNLVEGNVTFLSLCDKPIPEEKQLMQQFESTRDVAKKTDIGGKFVALIKADHSLQNFGVQVVEKLSEMCASKTKKMGIADRFQACAVRDELAKLVGVNIDSLSPKLETMIAEYSNLAKVCDSLQPRYYAIFLELLTRVFPDEWDKLCLGILRNCNDKLTSECIYFLKDAGCEDLMAKTFLKWLKEKSLRAALLRWIVKNRHAKKFEGIFLTELMSPELLRAIFWAIDNEALAGSGKLKKIPLVELLCSDRTLIRDLLTNATEDVVGDLAQTLLINQGIDNLSKKSLLARFIAIYPGIQELILSASKAKLPQDASLKVSLASLESKKKEYEILVKEKIPANKKAIEIAREHGDFCENSEYKMARQDQETLLSRKSQLEEEIRLAQVVDFSSVDTSMVSIGSRVRLRHVTSGEITEYVILGAWDSDPVKNIISYKTSIAQALLGKKAKDTVETVGDDHAETWQIEAILSCDQ
ncbi:MAG: GreA/GreB family elongation factor [Puniceicoccales bacterium]|nr:GreA/GreB family elongation factor [Puniceicoccales bacterium]